MDRDASVVATLKGGSLSGTYLMAGQSGQFVRKTISLVENREYGYVRWHSQLKRLQRFGQLFPGLFPSVQRYGLEGNSAYFDLEFIPDALNGYEFLGSNPPTAQVDRFHRELVRSMDRLHAFRRPSCVEALELYIYEEIERPIGICAADPAFAEFSRYDRVMFNGVEIPGLAARIPDVYAVAKTFYCNPWECYTHGNLTLENTLWQPSASRIWFIDPYEENIADTVHNEYSQVLQSSHSHYETFNALRAEIEGNRVTLSLPHQPAVSYFNEVFSGFLRERLSVPDQYIVRLYEVSQFTRMLPFKLHVAKHSLIFFYALASMLFDALAHDIRTDAHASL